MPRKPGTPASLLMWGADGMKAKFDALGVAVRAGVDPANAALLIGLDGVRFTGLQPVSLKNPDGE